MKTWKEIASEYDKYYKDSRRPLNVFLWLQNNYPAPQKWISVEDELPPPYREDGNVNFFLSIAIDGLIDITWCGDYEGVLCWFSNNNLTSSLQITHWQPLPEPPKQ
jgi:hypothetical protein